MFRDGKPALKVAVHYTLVFMLELLHVKVVLLNISITILKALQIFMLQTSDQFMKLIRRKPTKSISIEFVNMCFGRLNFCKIAITRI